MQMQWEENSKSRLKRTLLAATHHPKFKDSTGVWWNVPGLGNGNEQANEKRTTYKARPATTSRSAYPTARAAHRPAPNWEDRDRSTTKTPTVMPSLLLRYHRCRCSDSGHLPLHRRPMKRWRRWDRLGLGRNGWNFARGIRRGRSSDGAWEWELGFWELRVLGGERKEEVGVGLEMKEWEMLGSF